MPEPTDRVKVQFPGTEGSYEVSRKQFEVVHKARGATIVEEISDPEQSPGVKATAEADEKIARGGSLGAGAGPPAADTGGGEADDGDEDGRSAAARRRR